MTTVLLGGWAFLVPEGTRPHWWHWTIGGVVLVASLGSWHGQRLATTARRWTAMMWRNRRRRRGAPLPVAEAEECADPDTALQARIVIQLRPQAHMLSTPGDGRDQLPWEFVTSWLDRYGVRIDELTVCSVTATPPPSALRTAVAALVTARTPQRRDTWLTYRLSADNNVAALLARGTTVGAHGEGEGGDVPGRAVLAEVTARRLVAEFRERGWWATVHDRQAPLPRFVAPSARRRRECWTGTEHSDGFRAVYTVDPQRVAAIIDQLPTLTAKATWMTVTIRPHPGQAYGVEACLGTVTPTRPPRVPLAGLRGFHGLHHLAAKALTVHGFEAGDEVPRPAGTGSAVVDLGSVEWPTAAAGVPLGRNRSRQPIYLGVQSAEPVRITVTGTSEFHVGIVGRLALSGLPIAIYTAIPNRWTQLANHAAPQQVLLNPSTATEDTIVVTDGSVDPPIATGAFTVALRRPQNAPAPPTTVVITQDRRKDLLTVTTPRGAEWLSTQL
ncbi:hypothetical protein H7J07_02270 [Mycobacterium koreense]|uniref:Type VII secretion protein EccE n=1 Tax=Mycolicibacillus koreensis TaxID=1069220 RepID=A0AA91SQP5_9MYCO|nr:hypothetical protein [Mycolicibacillus koreensis]OSC31907.1 hypothetical protein B8W67_15510 [Mycolicibacillus koreensis]